jgi:hypothetical protein
VSAASTVCRQSKVVEYKPLGGLLAGVTLRKQTAAEAKEAGFSVKTDAIYVSPKYTSTASCVGWIATRIA